MEDLRARADDLGLGKITLEVGEQNQAALALYRSMGYVAVGRRAGYYRQGEEDAILMTWTRAGS